MVQNFQSPPSTKADPKILKALTENPAFCGGLFHRRKSPSYYEHFLICKMIWKYINLRNSSLCLTYCVQQVSLYERHSNAQPQYGHSEYSETSWFQEPGYYEAYQEEGYPGPQYVSREPCLYLTYFSICLPFSFMLYLLCMR